MRRKAINFTIIMFFILLFITTFMFLSFVDAKTNDIIDSITNYNKIHIDKYDIDDHVQHIMQKSEAVYLQQIKIHNMINKMENKNANAE